jgi:hypothetical protein
MANPRIQKSYFCTPANFRIESIWQLRQAVGEWRVFAHLSRLSGGSNRR